jgi:hypothetical protein
MLIALDYFDPIALVKKRHKGAGSKSANNY